ncbi:hypothetical protein OQJ15_12590 [Fluoribacter dumoffii]|uniref:hypothetical protein n=1 Tax=Fluoribacter dumoffii TaxID=463 RepID=UPI0022436C6A|nr:hypothetical protein [Fluoribacter dumoffii]MCW8387140.1 hypothetical protein [Fluoribacter dumoffii]MCW8497344.1 hypothetical protein [Fluoribacter dumoffii]
MTHSRFHHSNRFPHEKSRLTALISPGETHRYSKELQQLFYERNFNLWLEGFINYWNNNELLYNELKTLFQEWDSVHLQAALDYFSNREFAALVNAIFFYKYHPDKLFSEGIHPEKLISVQARLEVIHHALELMQQQLYAAAFQKGLIPGLDYLLHDEELLAGITIEPYEEWRILIQTALKKLKTNASAIHLKHRAIDCLYDLKWAYKFCFNPNRLIDAVMLLQQHLLADRSRHEHLIIFQEKMVDLYAQLTTTECLDLYGYFANKDTCSLLYIFLKLSQGDSFEELPPLGNEERAAITNVGDALCCVLESLRIELTRRHLRAEAYKYDLEKPDIKFAPHHRDAVLRVIHIYKHAHETPDHIMEQLFQPLETSD